MRRRRWILVGFLGACSLDRSGRGEATSVDSGAEAEAATVSCTDRRRNGDESDVDCGGSCPKCETGRSCNGTTDCDSGRCNAGKCEGKPSCSNKVRDGDETDIDCGGTCGRCADGNSCVKASDCTSAVCSLGRCASPSCKDGVANGSESDIDCGGVCGPCLNGKLCTKPTDCATGFCDATFCRTPPSCAAMHAAAPTLPSGVLLIDPDGIGPGVPFEVYCDMSTDGGGWTFFAHVNEDYAGAKLFETDVGSYRVDRADTTTYSVAGSLLRHIAHTSMYVALDQADAEKAAAASKLLFLRYKSGAVAFNKGPVPCAGLTDGFEYRVGMVGSFKIGTTNACGVGDWYLRNDTNTQYLTFFDVTPAGNQWGKAMGGDDSIKHDGFWYVR